MYTHLNLWLIRHGETEVNIGNWSPNPEATPLTALGREQAKNAIAEIGQPPDLLIVSPLGRAKETARFLLDQWPDTPFQTWPVQEFLYLSPRRLQPLNPLARKEEVKRYWQNQDPYYLDGENTESFASFLQRVESFYKEIIKQRGFVVVIGHGQFFKAFLLSLEFGFQPTPHWMNLFRQQETTNPIKNGEIIKLKLP